MRGHTKLEEEAASIIVTENMYIFKPRPFMFFRGTLLVCYPIAILVFVYYRVWQLSCRPVVVQWSVTVLL